MRLPRSSFHPSPVASIVDYTFGPYVASYVIALEIADFHSSDRGMDEFEFPGLIVGRHHDTDVSHILTAASRCEEYQVAFAEILAVDWCALQILRPRTGRKLIAELAVDVARESRAVEGRRAFGSMHITLADMRTPFGQQIINQTRRFGG